MTPEAKPIICPQRVDRGPIHEGLAALARVRAQIARDRELREAQEREEALSEGRHHGPGLVNPHS